jgi:hypothetical protein
MICKRFYPKRILIQAVTCGVIIVISGCGSSKTPLENLSAIQQRMLASFVFSGD